MGGGSVFLFAVGLILLIAGAEILVRGSSRLAAALGVPRLIIGLTIVAFGTSSPELVVSIQASLAGRADLALGNVIGSNIFNVLFILGLSAAIAPLVVSDDLIRNDVPIMIGASSLVMLLSMDRSLSPVEGALLLLLLVLYLAFLAWLSRRRPTERQALVPDVDPARSKRIMDVLQIGAGLIMLALGSRWLVAGSVTIARLLGLSELVIGLTVIAVGTSLPEVATSAVASLHGERDIAVGNIVGSNIFNLFAVLGTAALVSGRGVAVPAAALTFDMPVMIAVAMACLPVFFSGLRIPRWVGALFLVYWVSYATFLVLDATNHEAENIFGGVMLLFVVPLTVLTFSIVLLRSNPANAAGESGKTQG